MPDPYFSYSDSTAETPYVFIANAPELHLGDAKGDFDWDADGVLSDNEKDTNMNYGDPRRTANLGSRPYKKYGRYGPIPPGSYILTPYTKGGAFNGNPSINSPSDPNGNGHIIPGDHNAGDTNRSVVLIHQCGASQGCFTTPEWERVKRSMNDNDNRLPLTFKEICCGERKLVPLPKSAKSISPASNLNLRTLIKNIFKK
jgi:hypothetical protein